MAYETEQPNKMMTVYKPTPEEEKARSKAYEYLQYMIDLKNQSKPHFSGPDGERSWLQMVDDSERILNGYTLSREAQDKEAWQSNMMDNISRVKLRAIAASVGLRTPDMIVTAGNGSGILSAKRAEILKNILKSTFEDGNPTLHAFQQVWHTLAHGVVFEYEGYKTGGAYRQRVESFDSLTGEVKTKKEYVKQDGKPFSVIVNPQEFYWWDFNIRDIQDQPRIAWVQHYTRSQVQMEFSKFKNYKFLKDKNAAAQILPIQDSTFFDKWSSRVEDDNDYEVVRLFSKDDDLDDESPCYGYEIWINGIPMLRCPLLWGDKEKVYPWAKSLAESYANTNFFVGMPFGQLMEAYQDQTNTVQNTLIDKLYRSMKPPYLVGLGNKDLLEYEGKFVDEDNRFYVPDVNQVKPFPYDGVNSGELAVLQYLERRIEALSVDRAQQGQSTGGDKTKFEVQLADIRARELKGPLYAALEDHWWQKTKLRSQIVVTHYMNDKAASEAIGGQIITVKDYTFGDGARGILDIHVAKNESSLLSRNEVEARADAMEQQGIAYKIISITKEWLDDWKYDIKIVPLAFHQQDRTLKEEELMSEIQTIATLFPEFFASNKDRYLKEVLELRGKHPDEYNPPAQPQPMLPVEGAPSADPSLPPAASSPLAEGASSIGMTPFS